MSLYDGRYFRHHSVRAQFAQTSMSSRGPSELHRASAESWREKAGFSGNIKTELKKARESKEGR